MKLITIRDQIRACPDRWRQQYIGQKYEQKDKVLIYANLLKLDTETCSAEDVAKIIGNDSWACEQKCYECDQYHATVLQIGAEPDYESSTTWLCMGCVAKAAALFEQKSA